MIKFKEKQYTIPEGHYTGPKDMEEVPSALSVIGKTTLGGAGVGAVVGSMLKETGILKGAATGGKVGLVTGILLKILTNMLHNPMTKVKYQEVDKTIRREFGIFRASGITVGDSREKRGKLDEKFAFNDRDVMSFKINVAIQDNKVTLYTIGLTNQELGKVSDSLDYYCKKYFGMEYTSSVLDSKSNSYVVNIVFTNYQIISNFLVEVSDVLLTRINLLDSKSLVDTKVRDIKKEEPEEEEKTYSSIPTLDKYDLIKIYAKTGIKKIAKFAAGNGDGIAGFITEAIKQRLKKTGEAELSKIPGYKVPRGFFTNSFLADTLDRLRMIEGVDYTVGSKGSPISMYLSSGTLFIVVKKNSQEAKKLEKLKDKLELPDKTEVIGQADIYNYLIKSKQSFDLFIKTLITSGIVPNIHTK